MDNTFDKVYKEKVLDVFRFAIDFFKKNDLRWFAVGGTAIGAVRHRGMIPWDDDIDIAMPREDYEKLQSLAEEIKKSSKYLYISMKTDESYHMPMAKIFDSTTTLWENRPYPEVIGAFVDIFPLDRCTFDFNEFKSKMKMYTFRRHNMESSMIKYTFDEFMDNIKKGEKGCLYYGVRSLFFPKVTQNHFKKKFIEIEKIFDERKGDFVVSPAGVYYLKEHYKYDWFSDYTEVPFEDIMVRLPIGYDEYLRKNYGEYMTPPPLNKQITHHGAYYINLKERLSMYEIKKRINNGEHVVF